MFTRLIIVMSLLNVPSASFAQAPDVLWTRTYGGTGYDIAFALQQTSDGGYIMAGRTNSYGTGSYDVWLVRADSLGNVIWARTFGGTGFDEALSVWQNSDDGFILTGHTDSFNADSVDILLIRTDSFGNDLWIKTIGGPSAQYGSSVLQTSDGGFIVSGYTIIDSLHHSNALILNVDSAGNNIHLKEFDRGDYDYGETVVQTINGGYAFCGRTAPASISYDAWLVCADASGNPYCDKTFGGSNSEYGASIQQTSDGGFIIAGTTYSYGAGSADFWLVRTNGSGDTLWTKSFGGIDAELGESVYETSDGGFVITGYTTSFGSGRDIWVVRTDDSGDTLWTKIIASSSGEQGYAIQQIPDGGYIIAGETSSYGSGESDFWLIRLAPETALPVELTLFTAVSDGKNVKLDWTTATETNNRGFEVERRVLSREYGEGSSSEWKKIGFVSGFGTSTGPKSYSFIDHDVSSGVYLYRLKQIDFDGAYEYLNELEVHISSLLDFNLGQNYPNPFNPTTNFEFRIPASPAGRSNFGFVSLKVYDILGSEVAVLVNEVKQPGTYKIKFDAGRIPSGTYFYQLKSGDYLETKKMILMR
jgi:hypothetical protein